MDETELVRACDDILAALSDPRYAHTSHLHVLVGGRVVFDEHLRGPLVNDVFSVTKSVLATVLGVVAARDLLPPLDDPVARALPDLLDTPAAAHTWRHVLTMTRGAEVAGAWDVDEITALPGGQVRHIATAPQRRPAGIAFAYDNASAHLVSAAASAVLDEPVSHFADRELLAPLGIDDTHWTTDPDGVPFGYGHLRIGASDLARIGQLWLDGGRSNNRQILHPGFLAEMTSAQSAGGPPEGLQYGYLTWVDGEIAMAGGWGGQHMLVVPSAHAVVVATGETGFNVGPPPRDALPADWAPALDLIRRHLLPLLRGQGMPQTQGLT